MSKIVIIMGSNRKGGNTDLLANAFANGAKINNDVEIISVADYNVEPCIGCDYCFTNAAHSCFKQDDMDKVYKKLSEADIIVVASPVYFYGLSAQLKAIVDRLHNPIRNSFKTKKLGLILAAASSLSSVFDSILLQYKETLDFFGLEDIGIICAGNVRHIGDIQSSNYLKKAYELGKSIN
ncbi:MAG: flavodoxin family protein [Clostridiales bacterium]|nr:flavodoxin family protein [Clostridiales bacterium]